MSPHVKSPTLFFPPEINGALGNGQTESQMTMISRKSFLGDGGSVFLFYWLWRCHGYPTVQ